MWNTAPHSSFFVYEELCLQVMFHMIVLSKQYNANIILFVGWECFISGFALLADVTSAGQWGAPNLEKKTCY